MHFENTILLVHQNDYSAMVNYYSSFQLKRIGGLFHTTVHFTK